MNTDAEEELDIDEADEKDNEPSSSHVKFDIATYPSDLTLSVLHDMWAEGDITIPQFQRNFVWSIKQSSLLIESFLLGLPVPQVFFYIDDENKNLVIDGQQRILSIIFFLEGYFGYENLGRRTVFRLTGIPDGSPYSGLRFDDLSQTDQRRLKSAVLRVVNIRQLAPKNNSTSMYHIFERLNTGGTPLRPQEIRNCVFHGPVVSALQRLNENPHWRAILGRRSMDKHQRDVEILLRVFSLFDRGKKYEKPMKEFLNQAMKSNVDAQSNHFREFEKNFPEAVKLITEKLPEKPFHIRGPMNLAALDSVLTTLVSAPQSIPENIAERYDALLKDDPFREAIFFNTSDTAVVKSRLGIAQKFLLK